MIGRIISHYTILEKLGEGGMGVVYKAHDTTLDRDVALKFLPSSLTRNAGEKERFYHEARAAAALTHPNIAVVHEIGEYPGPEGHSPQLFIAMEYVRGETLKNLIGSDSLTIPKVLDIAVQVGEGLAAAHEQGIVHRDIKSENIILTPKGQAKITDFGLAKLPGATKLTMTGSTIGTAAYMSPEQARGDEVDQRSDIFSFGVVLYELLAGRLPFRGEHPAALMYSIVNEDPPPISKYNDKVSVEIERIVSKALAKDREERYPTATVMLGDLKSVADGQRPPVRVRAPRTKRQRNRARLLLAAAAVLTIITALFVMFRSDALPDKTSLAVIGFDNVQEPSDTSLTAESIASLLVTALCETKNLDVLSREQLYRLQDEMGLGDKKIISATAASRIALQAGVSTMLLGSIYQLRPALIVTYRIVDVGTGKIINSQRVGGFSQDNLFPLADTLALMVRSDLDIAPSEGVPIRSVTEMTTRSSEAYRAYMEGVDWAKKVMRPEATAAFRRAIELDSTLAMAHYYLGTGYMTSYADPGELRKAWKFRWGATEKERYLIEARYAGTIEENPLKNASLLEQYITRYPREQAGYWELSGVCWLSLGDPDRALRVSERGLEIDSLDTSLLNDQCYLLAYSDRPSDALRTADRYLQLAPAQFNSYDTKGDVFRILGEIDSALVWWNRAMEFGSSMSAASAVKAGAQSLLRRDYPSALRYFEDGNHRSGPVLISIHQGALMKAYRLCEATGSDPSNFWRTYAVGGSTDSDPSTLLLLAYEMGRFDDMIRFARERSAKGVADPTMRASDPTDPVRGRYEIAWALLKAGHTIESQTLMDSLSKIRMAGLLQRERAHAFYVGLFALERGEYDIAVGHFRQSMRTLLPNHPPEYFSTVALLKSGRIEEAVKELQRLTLWPPVDDYGSRPFFSVAAEYWPIAAVKAHYWLGVAYEQQGKKVDAIKEYQTFLDTWKNADFKSAEMEDARTRLSTVTGMK